MSKLNTRTPVSVAAAARTKAAILCRVSTPGQVAEGDSLEQQEETCRAYAERLGFTVVKVYSAQESSLALERSTQEKALAGAEAGIFKVLIVQDVSRFTSNMLNGLLATRRLNDAGVELHAVSAGRVDIETPQGQYLFVTLTGARGVHLSDHKNASIRRRVGIMEREKRPAAGRPPWGRRWTSKSERYEVIPEEKARLLRAYDLIARKGISGNAAAKKLAIASSSLRKAIRQSTLTKVTQRLDGKMFQFNCAPILTDKQGRELEIALAANATIRPRTKGAYLLQGLVRCPACGATMTGQTSTKGGRRYAVYRHPPGARFKAGCIWQVPVVLLDEDVLYACALAVSNGTHLKMAAENALVQADVGDRDLRERHHFLLDELKRTDARFERTLDRLTAFEEGTESRKRLEARAKADETRLAELKNEIAEVDRQLTFILLPKRTADEAAAKVRSLYWHGIGPKVLSFEQQRDFVRTMIGRANRMSKEGVYVRMHRPAASKKEANWRYEVRGMLMLASNRIGRHVDEGPETTLSGTPATGHVHRLAQIAVASPGITLPRRPYNMQLKKGMQMRMKPS